MQTTTDVFKGRIVSNNISQHGREILVKFNTYEWYLCKNV